MSLNFAIKTKAKKKDGKKKKYERIGTRENMSANGMKRVLCAMNRA